MKKRIVWASCSLFLITVLGCAATSIHSTENINWQKVRFAAVKSTQPDQWNFAALIRQELTSMGITSPENAAQPDVIITYRPEVKEDLTQESQRILKLQRLHLDIFSATSNTPITQIDHEFPPSMDRPDPAFAIREIFATLKTRSGSTNLGSEPSLPATRGKNKEALQTTGSTASVAKGTEIAPSQKAPSYEEQTNPKNAAEPAEAEIPSSWLPRFKSWGLEEWGDDSSQ